MPACDAFQGVSFGPCNHCGRPRPEHPSAEKRGKGGDSTDALRRIWMEGYEAGKRDAVRNQFSVPPVVVEIDPADIVGAYAEPCATPDECPACQALRPR